MPDSPNQMLKSEELELLAELKRLCQKHGLTYFLTAGTLLGAVRHKGFIPWDDDIDVAMPRRDFDRLAELCREELDGRYFYQDRHTDPSYPLYFAKLRKHGTEVHEPWLERIPMHKGIYIDIFPLDICPRGDRAARVFFKVIELLTFAAVGKIDPEYVCGYRKWYMRALYALMKRMPLRFLFGARDAIRRGVAAACPPERLCTVGGTHGYPAETYEAKWFEETARLEFEGAEYPAPGQWNTLLTNMYGDYMTPPPGEERQGHFEK